MTTASPFMPDVRVEIAFNSGVQTLASARTWTDVSNYVELDREIQITRGRQDEISTTSPSTLSLTLDNRDGRFTPGLASGAYYPSVKIGRPIRVLASIIENGHFDVDTSGWTGANALLARVTTPILSGLGSMRLTRVGAGDMSSGTPSGASGIPVSVGQLCVGSAWFRAAVTGRSCFTRIRFYDAGGSLVSTEVGSSVSDTTGGWTLATVAGTAPGTAAYAMLAVVVVAPGSSEQHYVDDVFFGSPRFTGYVDEWPVEWDGGDASVFAPLTASSRLARLGEGNELRSIIETEIMLDNPIRYYPLGEPANSLFATDLTGNDTQGMYSFYGGEGITFGTAVGLGTDGLPAVHIDPVLSTDQAIALATNFSETMTTCTIETFCRFSRKNTGEAAQVVTLWDRLSNGDATYLQVVAAGTGPSVTTLGAYTEDVDGASGILAVIGVDDDDIFDGGEFHHYALSYDPGSPPSIKYYIDGAIQGTSTVPLIGTIGTTMPGWRYFMLGPVTVTAGENPNVWCHAAVYDTVLSDARIAAHYEAGITGFAGEMAADRIERYAGYAGVEAAEIDSDTGVIPLGHVNSAGRTAESLLRMVEATEGGVLYDQRDGGLVFRDRDHRYTATSAFTLNAATGDIEASGFRPTLDRAFIVNDVTAKSADGTTSQQYADTAAADDYGPKRQDVELLTTDADELLQAAGWRVNQYKEPRPRFTSLAPVDVLTLDSALRAAIAEADLSTRFTLAGLPSQAEDTTTDAFVEGITETIGFEKWQFVFNTSPADIYTDVWTVEDPVLGQYDAYPLAY